MQCCPLIGEIMFWLELAFYSISTSQQLKSRLAIVILYRGGFCYTLLQAYHYDFVACHATSVSFGLSSIIHTNTRVTQNAEECMCLILSKDGL